MGGVVSQQGVFTLLLGGVKISLIIIIIGIYNAPDVFPMWCDC